jgi:glycosyltransferase involved in cell wall biosynthesis
VRDRGPNVDSVIGLDATYSVGKQLSGVGKYSLHLMDGLARLFPGLRLRRYYRPHRWVRAPWPKRLLLSNAPGGVNVFHGLNQRLPHAGQAKMVSTFHDLFVLSGEYSTEEFRARFIEQAREAADRSDRIIAVSEFTASQVVGFLGYPRERIRVVPHGVTLPHSVRPVEQREKIVLTVGAVQKRKNTRRLIDAFRSMGPDWQLWIAGSAGFEAEAMLKDLPANVKVLGYVSDEKLMGLYQRAAVFAFPSLDEGFGIPVLEAMAHGVPVLTSTTSALPEVAGDAAVLVDPLDVEAISVALRDLTSIDARQRWVERGLERAKEFSWERAAQMTARVYAELHQ